MTIINVEGLPPSAAGVLSHTVARLEEVREQFLNDGIVWVYTDYRCPYIEHPILPTPTLRKFVRAMAREAKRPFVWAETYHTRWGDQTEEQWFGHLTIPRLKKLQPVMAPFLLLPESGSRWKSPPGSFRAWISSREKTNLRVTFRGTQGRAMFHSMIQRVCNDPIARKAMGLNPRR